MGFPDAYLDGMKGKIHGQLQSELLPVDPSVAEALVGLDEQAARSIGVFEAQIPDGYGGESRLAFISMLGFANYLRTPRGRSGAMRQAFRLMFRSTIQPLDGVSERLIEGVQEAALVTDAQRQRAGLLVGRALEATNRFVECVDTFGLPLDDMPEVQQTRAMV